MAQAHDFWIEAAPFTAEGPRTIAISLRVGTELVGDSLPNITDWYRDFSYVHQGVRRPVPGDMGDDPAGRLPANTPGVYLIGHENRPDFVELDAERFHAYLREEGLEHIIATRLANGQANRPGREYYQRCVKSLVRVGTDEPALRDMQTDLGYTLEILPRNSPFQADKLKVRLLYQGKPVQGLLVSAFTKQEPERRSQARTDADGMAEVALDRPGIWLVKAVHMVPYQDGKADWISYWASLTFERR